MHDFNQLAKLKGNDIRLPAGVSGADSGYLSDTASAWSAAPVDFGAVYTSVFRHRGKLIAGVTLLGVVVAVAIALTRMPYYRAHATVELDGVNDTYLSIRDVSPESSSSLTDTYMQTEAEILGSEALVRRALGKNRPEPAVKTPAGFHFSISSLLQKTGLKQFTPVTPSDNGVGRVMQNLAVRPLLLTRIIEVTYDDTNPYAAANFTNALLGEYITGSVERRWESTQNTERWLTEYVSHLKANLEASSQRLESYASDSGLLGTKEEDTPAEAKLREIQAELSRAHGERVSKQALYETATNGSREAISPSSNPSPLREYQTKLSDLRSERAQLGATLTPEHFRVQRLDAQILEMERLISKEWEKTLALIESDYQTALRREKLLSDSVQAQTALVAEQAGKRVHFEMLRNELETNQQVYNSMLQKAKESAVLSATKPTNIHVIDEARPPALPFEPNIPIYGSIGGLSGFFVSLLWAGYSGWRDKNAIAPGTIPEVGHIRELGIIPSFSIDHKPNRHRALFRFLKLAPTHSLVFSESFTAAVGSMLRAECNGIHPRVITVTSAIPSEGKTTVVTNLGLALANMGRRVILIDGDMRHPKLSKKFNIANSWGLSDILQSSNSLDDMPLDALVKRTENAGLFVLPSGPSVVNISSLLYSHRLGALLDVLRKHADLILIDSPPLLAVSDARILGVSSNAVVLVVRAHKIDRDTFQTAAQQLFDDRTPLLGTILNDWDSRKARGGIRDPFEYQYAYRE